MTSHFLRSIPVLVMAVATSVAPLLAADLPDDTWPEAWFHPPEHASEAGVTHFSESPMLAAKVAAGTLPPLQQRLPDDPFVIVPVDEIGRHGGTLRCFGRGRFRCAESGTAADHGSAGEWHPAQPG